MDPEVSLTVLNPGPGASYLCELGRVIQSLGALGLLVHKVEQK